MSQRSVLPCYRRQPAFSVCKCRVPAFPGYIERECVFLVSASHVPAYPARTCHVTAYPVPTSNVSLFPVPTCHIWVPTFPVPTSHVPAFPVSTCLIPAFLVPTCHVPAFLVYTCHVPASVSLLWKAVAAADSSTAPPPSCRPWFSTCTPTLQPTTTHPQPPSG